MDLTKATGKQVTLVGVDYSEHSRLALVSAAAIVDASPGAELHVVHVIGGVHTEQGSEAPDSVGSFDPRGAEFIRRLKVLRKEVVEQLPDFMGDAAATLGDRVMGHIRIGRPHREIVRLAEELEAQLVVVGTRRHSGLERMFLGSVAEQVVREAPCAVLVARPRERPVESLIEAPCPDCVRARELSAGNKLWCARHAQHRPRAHTYGSHGDSFGMGSMTFRF